MVRATGSDLQSEGKSSDVAMEIAQAQQMVLVITDGWKSVPGFVRCFERRNAGWAQIWPEWHATVGRSGLAWAAATSRTRRTEADAKREGDGKAPAGVFPILEVFGSEPLETSGITRIRYRELSATMEGVDDPASRYYNRIVDNRSIAAKDWKSSERMRIAPYRWGAVVGYNQAQVPGAGSCIFLHIWERPGVATSGCTAMAEADLLRLLRWLDSSKKPVLVQLPRPEYRRLRSAWGLP
jgi:zinc D-Ala-D-Ala dipeptidase